MAVELLHIAVKGRHPVFFAEPYPKRNTGHFEGSINQGQDVVAAHERHLMVKPECYFRGLRRSGIFPATYTPMPKYPAVTRDLSLICDEEVTVAQIENVITAAAGKLLRGVKLFDIYRGTGVPEGKKSMAFSLELRADDRTLTDSDSEGVVNKVLTALKEQLNAILR